MPDFRAGYEVFPAHVFVLHRDAQRDRGLIIEDRERGALVLVEANQWLCFEVAENARAKSLFSLGLKPASRRRSAVAKSSFSARGEEVEFFASCPQCFEQIGDVVVHDRVFGRRRESSHS